jgi:hypothetical protein
MHILIGLVVATVLVIGWACGNLFACVFLSLPTIGLFVFLAMQNHPAAAWCLAALGAIWVPLGYRRGWFKQVSWRRGLHQRVLRNSPTEYGHDIAEPLRLEVRRGVAD